MGDAGSNYVVISADCHAGANVADYKPYLEARFHDDFDAWYATFENPYDDLVGQDAARNWDSARRLAEMQADGIVAEVLFPNTIPPFFPKTSLVHQPPGAGAETCVLADDVDVELERAVGQLHVVEQGPAQRLRLLG